MYHRAKWGYERVEEWSLWWIFTYLSAAGECRSEVMTDAWTFFHELFLDTPAGDNLTIAVVTRKLFELFRSGSEDSAKAELCLRCYISNHIRFTCDRLAADFSEQYGFHARDLWPFVLEDVPPRCSGKLSPTGYQSIADRVLETFDPNRASLTTYIDRLVKRHEDLKQFLLEHGMYQATNWGILNNTSVSQLENMPSQFYQRTAASQASQLLRAFHAVYRQDRLQDRMNGNKGGRCKPPNIEQLRRIVQFIHDDGNTTFPSQTKEVLCLLKNLATDLRDYHIWKKTGNLPLGVTVDPQFGYDIPDNRSPYEGDRRDDEIEEEAFLTQYRQELLECLDKAIAWVIEAWVEGFRQNKSKKDPHKGQRKAENFLEAMRLHYCDRISMTEIAIQLGLKDQPTVSKLLKLGTFRADVRHQTLLLLHDRIQKLASQFLDPEDLIDLDRRLEEVLGEQLDEIFGSAQNLFADRVCRYLDRR